MKGAQFSFDSTLLARIALGDEVAFKQIYDSYFPKIRAFAFRVLQDSESAQEVAQEVMLAFWQKGAALKEVRSVEAFLKTLAKRRVIDVLRRLQLARAVERNMRVDWTGSTNEVEEQIAWKETRQLLEDGLDLLPPQQQRVYRLCHQQGLKYEEVACLLDIAPGTVQSHMKLALRFLRNYLKQHIDTGILLIIFSLN